ncbi:hypothetical protein [Streptomyces sp. YGL11-2]|uniref:hypothetical protein n=1 Tax=Streptomyces sp. YGL11-2 TaxID=3414028 RepID=UPI003CE78EE4
MQLRTATTAAALAGIVLTTAAVAAPSYAAESKSPTTSVSAARHAKGPRSDGAKGLCVRVPRLEKRIEKRIRRIEGPVGTPGSIKYLEQRIDLAQKANHAAVAKFLGDRLTARKGFLTTLKKEQTDLKAVATWCAANKLGEKHPAGTTS